MRSEEATARTGYRVLVAIGLGSYGIVHLLVAGIAVKIAVSGRGNASSTGALRELAVQPLGKVLLWVMAAGLLALVVWQGFEATFGHRDGDAKEQVQNRGRAVGRAVVYLVLAGLAVRVAAGGGSESGNQPERSLTGRLLDLPFGRVLVVAVAGAVLAVGISQILKGVRRKFLSDDLRPGASSAVRVLGTVGWVAKGVAWSIVAGLFVWAAFTYDAKKAGGLDAALTSVRSQPYGPVLLVVLAGGLACFGLYGFAWAKNARAEGQPAGVGAAGHGAAGSSGSRISSRSQPR